MRTYVAPVGFNPTSVTRPVLNHGLDDGDAVVLLRPEMDNEDRRATETLTDIERMLSELEPDVAVDTVTLPHDDFERAVMKCSQVFRDASGAIVAIFGGGARDVFLPCTIAGLAHVDSIEAAFTFSDIDGAVREVELPRLSGKISSSVRETLAMIADTDEMTVPQLTEQSDQTKSTVTRHVNQLDDAGAISTWMDGKTKHLRITLTGRLRLQMHD